METQNGPDGPFSASPHLERLCLLDLSDEPLGAAPQAALHGRFGTRVKL
jgi:hypothetical protein